MILYEQKCLTEIYEKHFDVSRLLEGSHDSMLHDFSLASIIEKKMLSLEDNFIDLSQCPHPTTGEDFSGALKSLINSHAASRHPFYESFLPERASVSDVTFYLAQETLQDPRFDDFIAYLQIGLPAKAKLELAGNYWDEMGNGIETKMHTVMFDVSVCALGITEDFARENLTAGGIYCGNLSALLVLRRHLLFRAIGYFAAIEYLFPRRCLSLINAWKRLCLPSEAIEYHAEHLRVDARHASGFFKNVIPPLVDLDPRCAREIFWGACARLNSSGRHLDELLRSL